MATYKVRIAGGIFPAFSRADARKLATRYNGTVLSIPETR